MKLENANYHESNAMAVLGLQAGPSDFMGFRTRENGQVPKVWDLSGLKAFGSRHDPRSQHGLALHRLVAERPLRNCYSAVGCQPPGSMQEGLAVMRASRTTRITSGSLSIR